MPFPFSKHWKWLLFLGTPYDCVQKLKVVTIYCDTKRSPRTTDGIMSTIIPIGERIERGQCSGDPLGLLKKTNCTATLVPRPASTC